MSKQTGTVRHYGTNLGDRQSDEIDAAIAEADKLMAARRVRVLKEIDAEQRVLHERMLALEARRIRTCHA